MAELSTKQKGGAVLALIAAVGATTAGELLSDTKRDEGVVYHAYRDIGGVWTICSGTAHGVHQGDTATPEECDAKTAADLLVAYKNVTACAPELKQLDHHYQLRASIRFNNNTGAFCHGWWKNRPSVAALFRAHQWRTGCNEMLRYALVKGRFVRGLYNRRVKERAMCLQGVA
jgi:GH24 family phage-related lysozyme (muramidase)